MERGRERRWQCKLCESLSHSSPQRPQRIVLSVTVGVTPAEAHAATCLWLLVLQHLRQRTGLQGLEQVRIVLKYTGSDNVIFTAFFKYSYGLNNNDDTGNKKSNLLI